ncbi:SDR family oxidoreductase [Cupriavidus necator]|uniref:SDR family oxidoreductase n=1 Tax=Cupriavidus necator TaxID=106590 RepID=UPI0005B31D40|nr:SDR family oxidoreductase [Cupriavidus necator]
MTSRTFLVTGASKGIGRALSERLIRNGHRVVGLARNPDASFPGELVSVDLSDREETAATLEKLTRAIRFDGLVNNVGLVMPQRIGEVRIEDLDAVLTANLHPAVQAMQAVLPNMLDSKWGRVVNISSLTVLGAFERTSYAAAKAALISFSRSWALELATTGVTVNTVAPGPIETELFRKNSPPGSAGERRFLSAVPMNRFGKPEEIAAAIEFLLSEVSAFITGQTLFVDGGASIGKSSI